MLPMIPMVEPLSFQPPPHAASPRALVSADLIALLQHFDCGAVLLDGGREIVGMNDAAQNLCGDGLMVMQDRIKAASLSAQADLDALLDAAHADSESNIRHMILPFPSGERPLLLRAQPFGKDRGRADHAGPAALVLLLIFIAEPHVAAMPSDSLRALGLTRAEAAVAALLGAGFSPSEVSERLGIKIATVRTHLKRIYHKLALRRQAELVQLVTRLSFLR
jgi:DNA-binding CsgD family transcriptional regulator